MAKFVFFTLFLLMAVVCLLVVLATAGMLGQVDGDHLDIKIEFGLGGVVFLVLAAVSLTHRSRSAS